MIHFEEEVKFIPKYIHWTIKIKKKDYKHQIYELIKYNYDETDVHLVYRKEKNIDYQVVQFLLRQKNSKDKNKMKTKLGGKALIEETK